MVCERSGTFGNGQPLAVARCTTLPSSIACPSTIAWNVAPHRSSARLFLREIAATIVPPGNAGFGVNEHFADHEAFHAELAHVRCRRAPHAVQAPLGYAPPSASSLSCSARARTCFKPKASSRSFAFPEPLIGNGLAPAASFPRRGGRSSTCTSDLWGFLQHRERERRKRAQVRALCFRSVLFQGRHRALAVDFAPRHPADSVPTLPGREHEPEGDAESAEPAARAPYRANLRILQDAIGTFSSDGRLIVAAG